MSLLTTNRSGLNVGFTKKGSKEDGTDGAHKLSFRVVKGIKSATQGRPVTTGTQDVARSLNNASNIRIKTERGNRILDERRDKRIVNAYQNGTNIHEKTTAKRAIQAYKGGLAASKNPTIASVTKSIGEMQVKTDGGKGRPTKIKNLI